MKGGTGFKGGTPMAPNRPAPTPPQNQPTRTNTMRDKVSEHSHAPTERNAPGNKNRSK